MCSRSFFPFLYQIWLVGMKQGLTSFMAQHRTSHQVVLCVATFFSPNYIAAGLCCKLQAFLKTAMHTYVFNIYRWYSSGSNKYGSHMIGFKTTNPWISSLRHCQNWILKGCSESAPKMKPVATCFLCQLPLEPFWHWDLIKPLIPSKSGLCN